MATYNAGATDYAFEQDAAWFAPQSSARVNGAEFGWCRFTGVSDVMIAGVIHSAILRLTFPTQSQNVQLRVRADAGENPTLPSSLFDAQERSLTGAIFSADLIGLATVDLDVTNIIAALANNVDGDSVGFRIDDPNSSGVLVNAIQATFIVDYTPAGPSETVAETEIAEIVLAVGEATATRERSASVEIAEISLAVADATATTARLASVEVAELRLDVATAAATTARIAAVEIAEMSLAVGDATATREVIAETEVAEIVLSVATELTAVTAQVVAVEVAELRLDVAGATATTPRIASIEIADLQLATAAATATLPVEATTEVAELRLSVPGGNPVHAWGEVRLSFSARAASAS